MSVPIYVKLANEYTVEWPLWHSDGPVEEGDLPVSPELARRLKAWAAEFNGHYDWETGSWDSAELRTRHGREAHELYTSLREELGPGYEVVLDYWE